MVDEKNNYEYKVCTVGDTINKTNIIHIWLTVFTPQCYDFCRATGEEFKGF